MCIKNRKCRKRGLLFKNTNIYRDIINSLAKDIQALSSGFDKNSSQPASKQLLRCDSRSSATMMSF